MLLTNFYRNGKETVIIDTNIWISFIIGKRILKLKDIIVLDQIKIIITEKILEEISRVAVYDRFAQYFQERDVKDFLKYLNSISIKIELKSEVNICRDEKDNYLLALAQDVGANYIVTGDRDLLILEKFGRTEIIRFADFTGLFLQ